MCVAIIMADPVIYDITGFLQQGPKGMHVKLTLLDFEVTFTPNCTEDNLVIAGKFVKHVT